MIKQDVKECLRENYLPYAVSSIVDRAIVSIDGFKPSHRKLLYTMYKMALLKSARTKSANIVGQTMKLNPHGDQAIYETMVRLTKGYEALNLPYVDSKGNFGKAYSRDMAYAASRYTEAKLMPIVEELFKGIEENAVEMVDNYDGKMKEPSMLPVTFPAILSNVSMGIAVGIASNICSFNLNELCDHTIDLLKGDNHNNLIPDFSTGGELILENDVIDSVNSNGRGSVKIRSKYTYDKPNSCIDITEIPYTTTVEAIIDKIETLVKAGKLKEITDVRDETDLSGLKLTIDIKKNVDPDILMQKLFKLTPLQDTFSCNFNVLIDGKPRLLGVRQIVEEWIKFRKLCIKRTLEYDIQQLQSEQVKLQGLSIILNDLDEAVSLIRSSRTEKEAMEKLKNHFGLSQTQCEYVSGIRMVNMNQDWLNSKIDKLTDIDHKLEVNQQNISNDNYYNNHIISDLKHVKKTYGIPRKTTIINQEDTIQATNTDLIDDYNCTVVFTNQYVKKNIRYLDKQRIKDGDSILTTIQCSNKDKLLAFTDKGQVFTINVWGIQQCMPSDLGQFQNTLFGLSGENIVGVVKYEEGKSITLITQEGKCLVLHHEQLTGRKKQAISLGNKFENNKLIYADEYTNTVTIRSNKTTSEYDVNFDYYSSKPSNSGNFILNCRNGKKVIKDILKYY